MKVNEGLIERINSDENWDEMEDFLLKFVKKLKLIVINNSCNFFIRISLHYSL